MAPVPLNSSYSFVDGFVQDRNTLRVIAQVDELNKKKVPNTTLLKFLPQVDQKFTFRFEWIATKIVTTVNPVLAVLAIGPDGRVNVGTASGDITVDLVADAGESRVHGLIRDVSLIGNCIYATGMGRQVYRRSPQGKWAAIHSEILQTPSLREVRGFNAIHGRDESDVLAVGWYGEIYRRKANVWISEDSGTNAILNGVHVLSSGTAYACGQNGTLLKNSGAGWRVVDHDCTTGEFRSLQQFGDMLYVSSDDELFCIDARDRIKSVDVTRSKGSTFDSLHSNDGVLLSVGPKDVWWTTDAKKWHRFD